MSLKETIENVLVSLMCLLFIGIFIYALASGRVIELILICLLFIGITHIIYHLFSTIFSKSEQVTFSFEQSNILVVILIFSMSIGTFFFRHSVTGGLTSVSVLAERIHEDSKYNFTGSICYDGWISHSQGQETCSWHGGVKLEFFEGEYSKSWEQCRKEAKEISWLD